MENNGMKILGWVVLAIVVIGGGWYLLSHGGTAANETGPIKIGIIGPFTGDAASYGEPYQKTVQLAVDQINAKGGINGRQIEPIFEDGQCTGPNAVSAAQKLINVDGVQAIIGGFCSGETIPVAPIAEQAKVLLFSPAASSPALTGISHYFFRDYPSDNTQGKVLADAAIAKGWKKVAFMQEQTDYAAGVYNAFNQSFTAAGGTTDNQAFPTDTADFRSMLTKLKNDKPDALFIDTQTGAETGRVLEQLQQLGWKPPLLVDDATALDTATVSANSAVLEGAFTAVFLPDASSSQFTALVNAYKQKYGEDMPYQGYMATSYDAVNLIAEGIAKVGDNGAKLADWSRTISGYAGASGSITIKSDGDRASGHTLEVIHNGVATPVTQ
ncbi:MAG: ABC transporter substrate-binding protein [Patescibacteria group bacterium]|nr:ABC transporter substrate-binding protein [Patescibacteria group bacterium]